MSPLSANPKFPCTGARTIQKPQELEQAVSRPASPPLRPRLSRLVFAASPLTNLHRTPIRPPATQAKVIVGLFGGDTGCDGN